MIDHLMLLTNSPSTGDTRNIILYITIAFFMYKWQKYLGVFII